MRENALIVFYKYPERSKVKTRLATGIGEYHTLNLYKAFLKDIFKSADNLDVDTIACVAGGNGLPVFTSAKNHPHILQRGRDIGERMKNAFQDIFRRGYSGCVLIGCDCPDLSSSHIADAFAFLKNNDIVLGPSRDGGYYLIGFNNKSFNKKLFSGINWGTHEVLHNTLKKIRASGATFNLLPEFEDIDDYEDLMRFYLKYKYAQHPGNTLTYIKSEIREFYEKKI